MPVWRYSWGMQNPVLVEALRGAHVESVHRGAVVVSDDLGRVVFACGDIERPVFPRSAVKLLQAIPLVASGAADALGLNDAELALACASHGGEPAHAATAAGMLAKAGVDLQTLECGVHWPTHEHSERALAGTGHKPTALHNNCSGKHAGFICLGCGLSGHRGAALQAYTRGYVEPDHPIMREVTQALGEATDMNLAHAPRGTDGCSIPTFAIPLSRLALAFARAGTGRGLSPDHAAASARLRRAIAAEPFMVAGTERLDTLVMARLGQRVCCKVGAEGVYCACLPELGWGVAIKMDDGNTSRAVEVVMAAVLLRRLPLDDAQAAWMGTLADKPLRNWQGREVGRLRAVMDAL